MNVEIWRKIPGHDGYEIRKRCVGRRGELTDFSKSYGVGVSTISDIRNGKIWKHVVAG